MSILNRPIRFENPIRPLKILRKNVEKDKKIRKQKNRLTLLGRPHKVFLYTLYISIFHGKLLDKPVLLYVHNIIGATYL